MKKGDTVIIASCVLVCILLFVLPFHSGSELTAVVTVDGEVKREVVLSEVEGPFSERYGNVEIAFSKDGAEFISSDCSDKLCVKSGMLKKEGDAMACIPNKIVVSIEGKKNFDGVAY